MQKESKHKGPFSFPEFCEVSLFIENLLWVCYSVFSVCIYLCFWGV